MISEALEKKLERLNWDQRRTLHFLVAKANSRNYIYHDEGRSVATMVAFALDCHQSSAYELVTQLQEMDFLITEPHPAALRSKRSHGYCVLLLIDRDTLRDNVALAILRFPPKSYRWLCYNPVYRAHDDMPLQLTW